MDVRSCSRFASYKNSLAALAEIKSRDLTDSFVVSGAGAKFNITFDLAWKVMKDIIIQEFAIVDFPKGSPKEVLRKAFECGLISDDGWMAMLADRNNLAHDYDGEIVNDVCARLIESYLDLFWDFSKAAGKYYPD